MGQLHLVIRMKGLLLDTADIIIKLKRYHRVYDGHHDQTIGLCSYIQSMLSLISEPGDVSHNETV